MRIPGHRAPEIQLDFSEGPKILWVQSAACNSQKVHYATRNFEKERVQSQGVIQHTLVLMSAIFMLQSVKTDQEKKP